MRKTKAEINDEIFRSKGALDLLMCYLGIEYSNDGRMYFYDDDDNLVDMYIDGMRCIYPFVRPAQRGEIDFNVYFNTKLMLSILEWYFAEHNYIVSIQKITNGKPDNIGHFLHRLLQLVLFQRMILQSMLQLQLLNMIRNYYQLISKNSTVIL